MDNGEREAWADSGAGLQLQDDSRLQLQSCKAALPRITPPARLLGLRLERLSSCFCGTPGRAAGC